MDTYLKRLIEDVETTGKPASGSISREAMLSWMKSEDLEALGATHALLARPEVRDAISPNLEFKDYFWFTSDYLFRCLEDNKRGEWTSSRYEAGWELCRWFIDLWHQPNVDRALLTRLKERLAELYSRGDAQLQKAVVNAVLEHLFEDREIAAFFQDWSHADPHATAYEEARSWAAKGGSSSLHDRPEKKK
jgi:hypothetical protein